MPKMKKRTGEIAEGDGKHKSDGKSGGCSKLSMFCSRFACVYFGSL